MSARLRRLCRPLATLALLGLLALTATGCMGIPWRADAVSRDAAFEILGRAPRQMTPAMKDRAAQLRELMQKGSGRAARFKFKGKDLTLRSVSQSNWWTLLLVGYIPSRSLQVVTLGDETVQTYLETEAVMPLFPAAVLCGAASATSYWGPSGEEAAHMANFGLGFFGSFVGRARELSTARDSAADDDESLAKMPSKYYVRKRVYLLMGMLQFGRANQRYYMQLFLFPIPLWRASGQAAP